MTAKFVVRWMTADDRLVAWAEVWAESRPQEGRGSCPFWAKGITRAFVTEHGTISKLVVHWTDLDVVRTRPEPPCDVQVGQVLEYAWLEPVWMVQSERGVILPPVTVGTQRVEPPMSLLGARDSRA